jgi:hypothetical protein
MFVAQLSDDTKANLQITSNLVEGREGGTLELGRFVEFDSFRGLNCIRTAERFAAAERNFAASSVTLGELATAVRLGRHGAAFQFDDHENAIFVPLIGISDVVHSLDELTLKPQNYAQVVIDPIRSNSRFVARFLNSELGKESIEASKSGSIPKLNTQTLKDLRIIVPDRQTQNMMLEIEARIAAEQNTILGLEIQLDEFRTELWSDPRSAPRIHQLITEFAGRLSGDVQQYAAAALEQWFETLPFPIASILRAWQATPSKDFKTKYEHLLHFFEGAAEFISIILLSAFRSNGKLFESHRSKISESVQSQHLSFERATFGTWKFVIEYLGKQTRQLLAGDHRALCAEMFAHPTLGLPDVLSRTELAAVMSNTNKMRNDWTGHTGVLGQDEARRRNEQLLGEVQKLREVLGQAWAQTHLIQAVHCRPRRGVFENEIAVLMGSNSEFLKETRAMATWLDVDSLYLSNKDHPGALKLLPLLQIGPSPQSAKNACYFFSRLERDGARFISYHYAEYPELTGRFDETTEAIKFLTNA